MNLRRIYVSLLLLYVVFSLLSAQDERWFRHLNIDNGLSHNIVNSVTQDSMGYYWIGTRDGLNRYDGYTIKTFLSDPADPGSISGNAINELYTDRLGRLWIGIHEYGINLLDREKNTFRHFHYAELGLDSPEVLDIFQDSEMNMWIATQRGLYVGDRHLSSIEAIPYREEDLSTSATSSAAIFEIFEDEEGNIWLGTFNGLNLLDKKSRQIRHFFPFSGPESASGENWVKAITPGWDDELWLACHQGFMIFNRKTAEFRDGFQVLGVEYERDLRGMNDILIDQEGNVWLAGWEGLAVYELKNRRINYLPENEDLPYSFPQGSSIDLFMDNIGSVWVGTWNRGISYHNREIKKFGLLSRKYDPDGLTGDIVRCVLADSRENFWIGIDLGGLVYYDRKKRRYTYYRHDPDDPGSLVHDNLRHILLEENKSRMWIATQHGLDLMNFNTGKFRHFLKEEGNSIVSDDIRFLTKDVFNNIWIGTYRGISVYNEREDSFTNFLHDPDDSTSLSDNRIYSIFEDSNRDIWIGTRRGLNRYIPSENRFERFFFDPGDSLSLSHNFITTIFEDSQKRLWIGTYGGGLNLMKGNGRFTHFSVADGLPNNVVYGILEDSHERLWLSTNKGLSRFDPIERVYTNFDRQDGLQSNQFYFNAFDKTSGGELLFGGVSGLNFFRPEDIRPDLTPPRVIITGFRIFNQPVEIGPIKGQDLILNNHISYTDSLVLKYSHSVFSFDFVGIHLGQPQKHKYAYRLEGLEEKWNHVGSQRTATYTNLDAGEYVFHVKASNSHDIWNEKGKSVHITILPPWWETTWFRLILGFSVLIIFYLLALLIRNREELKTNLQLERIKAEKDREIDSMKLRFYSNISHEFRTPLTLILGPVESMITERDRHPELAPQLNVIRKNARRLLRLINQLMDLSRIESGYMKLKVQHEDIIEFLKGIAASFDYRAERLQVDYSCRYSHKSYFAWYDSDKIEKILYNLLSNAFKFTPAGGKVELEVTINQEYLKEVSRTETYLQVQVVDTGTGISNEKQSKIFDRFYQDDNKKASIPGTGIGLTLTKQLTEIHRGDISLKSMEGKGSVFSVKIPVSADAFGEDEKQISPAEPGPAGELSIPDHLDYEDNNSPEEIIAHNKEQCCPELLIIDDNKDILNYLRSNLREEFNVNIALDPLEGTEKMEKTRPDIILCDVMMPGMDGFEFCRKIRSVPAYSGIPIILLTAKSGVENRIKGLESGADDYIIKPFYIEELKLKLHRLADNYISRTRSERRTISLSPSEIEITPPDEKFIKKALEIIEKNMDDSEFSINQFAMEMGTSRMQLYRKISAITNQTVKEFIRNIRLERAAQLMRKDAFTINEIAYMVGFREISYFRKCFKGKYGLTPSDYIFRSKQAQE